MKTLTKFTTAAVLAASASFANASPLFLDAPNDYDFDGNTTTGIFTSFILSSFSPTSAYLDLEGDGIQNGTLVFDSGKTTVGALSPLAFPASFEGFNTAWRLDVEYELFGFAGIADDLNSNGTFDAGDSLAAQFVGGYFTMSFFDGVSTEVLNIAVTGSDYKLTDALNLSIFGKPVSGTDFVNVDGFGSINDVITNLDPVNYSALTTIKILDATQAPTLDAGFAPNTYQQGVLASLGLATLPGTAQWLTRTTTIDSSNVYINVPAPASIALMGLGLLGLGVSRRFKK